MIAGGVGSTQSRTRTHRPAVLATALTLLVLHGSAPALALTGPVTTPPGGFSVSPAGCASSAACGPYTVGGSPITYQNFDFTSFKKLYWATPFLTNLTTLVYSASSSDLASGIAVWTGTTPWVIGGLCPTVSYDIRVLLTVTDVNNAAYALTDGASVGLAGAGAVVDVTRAFKISVRFQRRTTGTSGAWSPLSLDVTGCGVFLNVVSQFTAAGQFWYDAAPTVTSLTPDAGPAAGGQSVTFAGTCCLAGASATFDTTAAAVGSTTNTSISATTPPHAPGPVTVTLSNAGGTTTWPYRYLAPPVLNKTFTPAQIEAGSTTTLTFTITNPSANSVAFTSVGFTDTLPAGLTVVTASAGACGGTLTTTAPRDIALSGATLAASAQCMFGVTVTGAVDGSYTNTTGPVTSTNGGTGNTATANLTVTVPCTYVLTPSGINAPSVGMSSTFDVTAANGCTWTALSDSAWLTTSSTGSGNGLVAYDVAPHTLVTGRSGVITVGGQPFTVTQSGVSPSNLVAAEASTTSISLTWSSGSVDHFEVWRNSGSGFVLLGSPTTPSYTDSSVSANSAHVYKVRAVDSGTNVSAYSNSDLATTVVFIDDPLVAGSTVIKAVHVVELRAAVNIVRAAAGLGAFSFSDPDVAGLPITLSHVTELRSALDAARTALGVVPLSYTSIGVGSLVSATDMTELRDGVK